MITKTNINEFEKCVIIGFPDIQEIETYDGFEDNAHLLADGACDYAVNADWLNSIVD